MTPPLVFVTVGTDHHPFNRLIGWMDDWVARCRVPVRYVVQHGSAAPSRLGHNLGLVTHQELLELIREATVVVTQGGPGSIVDVRSTGRVPIAVPRIAALGEVVDDHQRYFCEVMRRHEACFTAHDEATLGDLLDQALADPKAFLRPPPPSPSADTAAELHRAMEEAVTRGAGWVALRRLMEQIGVGRPPLGTIRIGASPASDATSDSGPGPAFDSGPGPASDSRSDAASDSRVAAPRGTPPRDATLDRPGAVGWRRRGHPDPEPAGGTPVNGGAR